MPAKSEKQLKLIYTIRNKYKNKKHTPIKWQWVWGEEWGHMEENKIIGFTDYLIKEKIKELVDLYSRVDESSNNSFYKKLADLVKSLSKMGNNKMINRLKSIMSILKWNKKVSIFLCGLLMFGCGFSYNQISDIFGDDTEEIVTQSKTVDYEKMVDEYYGKDLEKDPNYHTYKMMSHTDQNLNDVIEKDSILAKSKESTKKIDKDVKEFKNIQYDETKKLGKKIKGLPINFDIVPSSDNVFRSNQPKLDQLRNLLETYDIDVVIRMNAEEKTGVTIEQEKELVESMGKKFLFINAHEGYVKGKGYVKSLDKIQPYLRKGKVLIHCTQGADRTGYQIGKFIQDNLKWNRKKLWDYTVRYNSWELYIAKNKNPEYIKYMEAFYPWEKWIRDNK